MYLRYAEKYGVPQSSGMAEKLNQAFREAFAKAPPSVFAETRPEKLKQCERLWWFDIVHAVFYRVGMFDGFDDYFEDVHAAFSTAEVWEVYADVPDTLETLKARGYELGIISNFDTRFFPIFRALNLERWFDSVTVSCTAGAVKPSPNIFHRALAQHVVEPAEALHVGDRQLEDYEGATAAGLSAVLIDRDGAVTDDGIPCIRHLGEVAGVVEGMGAM